MSHLFSLRHLLLYTVYFVLKRVPVDKSQKKLSCSAEKGGVEEKVLYNYEIKYITCQK